MIACFVLSLNFYGQDYIQVHITSPSQDYIIDATLGADYPTATFPDPVSGEMAIANDGVSGPADNDTWNIVGSYCCDSIINGADIAGKVALISRGSCSFWEKITYAWDHGATAVIIWNRAPLGVQVGTHVDGLITMTLAGIAEEVDIPGYFISHEDGLELHQLMQDGPVNVTFDTPSMYDATGPYAYATPVDQIIPLDDIRVATFTRHQDTLFNVEFNVTITDPMGTETILTTMVPELLPGKDATGTVIEPHVDFDSYTPPALTGSYSMVFTATTQSGTHALDNTVIEREFIITENTFALEDGSYTDPNGVQMNYEVYSNDADGLFNMGAFYRMGSDGSASHASFAIGNPAEIFDNGEFEFEVFLYDADMDDNGEIDPGFYNENPIADAAYEMTGDETANQPIVVTFDAPADVSAGGIYCVVVNAGDQLSFTDNQPAFTTSGDIPYPLQNTFVLFGSSAGPLEELDGLEYWNDDATAGFAKGGRHPIIQLHMDGFVGIEEYENLSHEQFHVGPVPATERIRLFLDLESNYLDYMITDCFGKRLDMVESSPVNGSEMSLDVSHLAAGTYFLSIRTEEGIATRAFIVQK